MFFVVRTAEVVTMLRSSRAFAQAVKKTTGYVGLDVVPEARSVLIGLYKQTLEAVRDIPETAEYRKNVEATTQHRLSVCEEESDVNAIESRINAGQAEELIKIAKGELTLISHMKEWKAWEEADTDPVYKKEAAESAGLGAKKEEPAEPSA